MNNRHFKLQRPPYQTKALKQQALNQAFDALKTVLDMFENNPELKEIDAEFPRGSVFGIVKAAYEKRGEAGAQ